MSQQEISSRIRLIESTVPHIDNMDDGDLSRLTEALLVKKHADALLDEVARRAQAAGRSWAAVGATLGMSRQAARQRWGAQD